MSESQLPNLRKRRQNETSRSESERQKRSHQLNESHPPHTTTTATEDIGNSGAYSSNFQQTLIDGGIYPYGYRYPDGRAPPKPNNWDEINQRLMQPVPSLSPSAFSDEKFEEFVQADEDADNEEAVRDSVITKLLDVISGPHRARKNVRFSNLYPLNDLDWNTLKWAQPDYYYGAKGLFLNNMVDNMFGCYIAPSNGGLILPNLFIEAKGPLGQFGGVKLQACYDGAIGTRAMHSLQSFAQRTPAYDNKAYTISATYHNGKLKMYSHYTTHPNRPGTRPEYYMHQLISFAMTGTKESHLQGLTALQNAADWAREMRDAVIGQANETALRMAFEKIDAKLSSTTSRYAHGTTSLTLNSLIDDESETPMDEPWKNYYSRSELLNLLSPCG